MYVVTVTQKLLRYISYCLYRNIVHSTTSKQIYIISVPIEIQTLRIGDFAAGRENDLEGLIPRTKAGGDQHKILRLVVGSNFSWVVRGKKIKN